MKLTILLLLAFLWLGGSASAADWYVRTDGGSVSRCTGHTDAPDPGSGVAQPCAYSSLYNALDAVVAGDTVKVKAGHTFDGTFDLPNKSCTQALPCTLTSTAAASLPAGRVGPSDAANMPRLRASAGTGGLPALRAATNAAWWIVDGFEITDNAGTDHVPWLVDWATGVTGVHDMTIQRCWIHQKETGTNYLRSVRFGVGWGGNNLTFKWNYLYLIGYYYSSPTTFMDTMAITVGSTAAGVSGLTVEDNYISVWYSAFYFGGQDTDPGHTATLASGATTTQATFSSVTGLVPGTIILLSVNFNATASNINVPSAGWGTLTRNSGAVLTSADTGNFSYDPTGGTAAITVGNDPQMNVNIHAVNGDVYDVYMNTTNLAAGTYNWELLTTVMVDSVVGNVVTYHPYGTDRLAQAPSTPGAARWSVGDEGLINDITIRKNTIYIDPAFAEYVFVNNNAGPKGYFELKNCNRMTVEGNRFGGWPSILAWTGSNQTGLSPWTTVRDIIIRNNWIEPLINATTTQHSRQAIHVSVNQYRTGRPAANLQIYNNVFKGFTAVFTAYVENQSVTHNTFINNTYGGGGVSAVTASDALQTGGFILKDNILTFSGYGLQCTIAPGTVATCWNPNTILNNVVIADWTQYVSDVWGAGGILAPVRPANASAIGFTDLATDILSLAVSSPYKGDGTGGTDPGVDWAALQAALTGSNNAPIAGAGLDQNLGPVTSTTLMGTASDPDGDTPLTYSWVRTSGPNTPTIVSSTALTTLITGMTTGTYVFTLIVTDPDGASSSDMVSVTIAASGQVTSCRWQTSPVCQP